MMRGRSSRSRFNAMRRGAMRNKAMEWIPLAPEDSDNPGSTRLQRAWNFHTTQGSNSMEAPTAGWLFAITPENGEDQGGNYVHPVKGSIDASSQYRVAGIRGNLWWTPVVSLNENPSVEALSGFLELAWYKLRRGAFNAFEPTAGTPSVYPWRRWNSVEAGPLAAQGFVSNLVEQNVSTLNNRDNRFRGDVMRRYVVPWTLNVFPVIDSEDVVRFEYVANKPIKLPLPRKVVANVGADECLALAYQVYSQSNVNVSSSPAGIFHFDQLRVKVYELG